MSSIRKKTILGLTVGDSFTVSRTFTESDVTAFADMSKDYNPVHFDDRFASVKKFNGRICHGLLVAGLITEIGGQIGWLASSMAFNFKNPVYFGDTITCRFKIIDIDKKGRAKADAIFINDHDVVVIEGHITGILPGIAEKQVMAAMVAEGDPTNKAYCNKNTLKKDKP